MGLKSGSRDAGLDDADDEDDPADGAESTPGGASDTAGDPASGTVAGASTSDADRAGPATEEPPEDHVETTTSSMTDTTSEPQTDRTSDATDEPTNELAPTDGLEPTGEPDSTGKSDDATGRPAMSAIPYKMRREKVNEGRDQVPFFLRKEIIDAEDDLQDELEALLGEDVYKSDYREAAMVVAQRNPGLVADVLREWGYDLQ